MLVLDNFSLVIAIDEPFDQKTTKISTNQRTALLDRNLENTEPSRR